MKTITGEFGCAVVYTDQGPRGACGQDCRTTGSWTKVWLFRDEEAARGWLRSLPESSYGHRKRPLFAMVYADQYLSGGIESLIAPQ
jgi:hypothetical protein